MAQNGTRRSKTRLWNSVSIWILECVCIEGLLFSVPWRERQFSQYNYKFDIWSPNCIKFCYQSRHSIWQNAKSNFHVVFDDKWYMQVHVYSHDWRWIMQVRDSQVLCCSKNWALAVINKWKREKITNLATKSAIIGHIFIIIDAHKISIEVTRHNQWYALCVLHRSLIRIRPMLCVCDEDCRCNWLTENVFRSTCMLPEK